jgi:iron uptake system component EfeO
MKKAMMGFWLALSVAACGKSDEGAQRARVETEMKAWLLTNVKAWREASAELAAAAPVTAGRGWDREADAASIQAMKQAWGKARAAYEVVEGAIAPIFPESDTATDARYDDYLLLLGSPGDPDAFDERGIIGMHGIERILWADTTPKEVIEFEKNIPGYRPALQPATEAEARAFKDKLAAQLVKDIAKLESDLKPLTLDISFAFRGLMDLAAEQLEKVDKASTGREESRYAMSTMRDLRSNREGCLAGYRLFRPWLLARGGEALDARVQAAFDRLKLAYDSIPGDAIPRPPEGWSSIQPKPEHRASDFGKLYFLLKEETDPRRAGSLSHELLAVAEALELPKAVLR